MTPTTASQKARQKPRLLSESELRRFEDCANENETLADCWASDQIVIVACERSDSYRYLGEWSSRPMELHVMSPADKLLRRSRRLDDQRQDPSKSCYKIRTICMLEKSKVHIDCQPRPWTWYSATTAHETIQLYDEEAQAKAQETLDALGGGAYATICVVSYDLRETMAALALFGVKLPSCKLVFVDLVKVLEHQMREEGSIPEPLRKYTDANIVMRNGRLDRRPGPPTGNLGMPSLKLVEVVGPAAESHREDFKRLEKEDMALKRIASRIRNG
ncbi:hypothetical protein CORC01_02948 [Colletotrichum orchidophilum]|uniref:Uncharacterized protein n=1 Tax=Colletotrichum orchidophilum TaxID=1209926 RepID=A0A1G4BKD6_9PEZI|nr:uncharacterized protein CORC01_02948 [Colletotrichum orchidophilum]OHF01757.1 hypothetical protein CORC01_02948 [Colletotrichum orchidophilum]